MELNEVIRLNVINKGYYSLKEERGKWVVGVLILRIGVRVFTCGVAGLAYQTLPLRPSL